MRRQLPPRAGPGSASRRRWTCIWIVRGPPRRTALAVPLRPRQRRRRALPERQRSRPLTYRLDERLLFCLINALVSWNAMEASALIGVSREPDVYVHDLHRSMVHFTLLS
ncbi:MAG: hypothetical protein WDM85_13715 [Caulobacteraceae bacterium]